MSNKKQKTQEQTAPSNIKLVEFVPGMRKSDYCRSLIRENITGLQGEAADEVRKSIVTQMVQATGQARSLARVYVKENIARVVKALKKEQEA